MTNLSNDLLYEVLRRIHVRQDKNEQANRMAFEQILQLRQALGAHRTDMDLQYIELMAIRDRLDRIEHRLELREFNEAAVPFRHEA